MKNGAKIPAESLTLVWSVCVRPGEIIALACRPPERNGVPGSCLPRSARRPEQSYARRVLPDFSPFLLPSWRIAAAYSTLLTLPPWSDSLPLSLSLSANSKSELSAFIESSLLQNCSLRWRSFPPQSARNPLPFETWRSHFDFSQARALFCSRMRRGGFRHYPLG